MFRTEKQRKEICSRCPVAKVANLIGDSCVLLIVRDLLLGPRRFGDLQVSLRGVSSRTLARKLKDLQDCDLVRRLTLKGAPWRAEYVLTKKGTALRPVTEALRRYSEKYL